MSTECDNCGYDGPRAASTLSEYRPPFGNERFADGKMMTLCHVCAASHASSALTYPHQCPDTKLLVTVAQIGNMILDAIAETREAADD